MGYRTKNQVIKGISVKNFKFLVASTVFVALMSFGQLTNAGFYNPKTQFYTVKTEHFRIHYSEGLGHVAAEMVEITERVHDRLTKKMFWEPKSLLDPTKKTYQKSIDF